jgi:hypothetical protein
VTLPPSTTIDAPHARHRARARAPVLAVALGAVLGSGIAPARAQDRADLDRTQITGNRELPKVLYIVPWKKPLPLTMAGRPVASVLDEALAPVDRDVFRRQIRYDAQLRASLSPASPAQPAPEKTP